MGGTSTTLWPTSSSGASVLEELHVRDLALIEEVWLELGPGMTVLTGETGAGKTALVGALKLLLGERADSGAVRTGSTEALVEGRFVLAGAEVLARRRIGADGRSRCSLDGEMATVGAMSERLGPVVDLHGQHEHQSLLSTGSHVGYLDRWIGDQADSAAVIYRAAREAYREATEALDTLRGRIAQGARDADYLRFVLDEIERVAPKPGEDDELEAMLPALQHAERLAAAADDAMRALRGDGGARDRVAEAGAQLSKVAGIDARLDELAARVAEAEALLDDAGTALRGYRDAVEHDPSALDAAQARLAALAGLKKKHGPDLASVLRVRDEAIESLAATDDSEAALTAAEQQVAQARERLRHSASVLSELREAASPSFTEALAGAVADLEMPGSSFEVGMSPLPFEQWTTDGAERVEFLYSSAPGQPPRPLAKIASGGEISRVMLALKSVLGDADAVETLVFDEVDAGIGGATASAVGRRLRSLSETHQVLVVTHLAQVAAFADRHLVVSKSVSGDGAVTTVREVAAGERTAEIARMLSGTVSDASLEHARELLGTSAAG